MKGREIFQEVGRTANALAIWSNHFLEHFQWITPIKSNSEESHKGAVLVYLPVHMDPVLEGFLQIFQRRFFSRWKQWKGAIFEGGKTGKARLELYSSDSQYSSLHPAKIVVLGECLAIRLVNFGNNGRVIQIQQKNAPVLLISVENLEKWHFMLCKAAFPDQFVTLSNQQCTSILPEAIEENDDGLCEHTSANQIPVLMQYGADSKRYQIPEGNYIICFGETIMLKNGPHCAESWGYHQLIRVGTGDRCFFVELDDRRQYEFKCSQPWNVVNALRGHLKLKADGRQQRRTKNEFTSEYTCTPRQDRESTTKSVNCLETPSALVRAQQHKRVSLLRGLQHKHNYERSSFEINADGEWIRYSRDEIAKLPEATVHRRTSAQTCDVSKALKFKEELELTIASKQPQVCLKNNLLKRVLSEDDELTRVVGGLNSRLRESVASEPGTQPPAPPSFNGRQSLVD